MALQFKFESNNMDKIMYVVRKYNINPTDAVNLIFNNEDVYKEAKNAIKERDKNRDYSTPSKSSC